MSVNVIRKDVIFQPDASRVIARFMYTSDERGITLINKILALTDKQQREVLTQVLRDYSKRHRSISRVFEKHFNLLAHLFASMDVEPGSLKHMQKILIGSYFTMEYSLEAAAFFNPSIFENPDQSEVQQNEKRIIISFRATGEGHISSIVFRSGIIDSNNRILLETPGKMLESPEHVKNHSYHKNTLLSKLEEMQDCTSIGYRLIANALPGTFTYEELKKLVEQTRILVDKDADSLVLLDEIMWLASSHYEMDFSVDTSISERVIFPIADTEMKGIEDARFVRFTCSGITLK